MAQYKHFTELKDDTAENQILGRIEAHEAAARDALGRVEALEHQIEDARALVVDNERIAQEFRVMLAARRGPTLIKVPAPVWTIEDLQKVKTLTGDAKVAFKAELMTRLIEALSH